MLDTTDRVRKLIRESGDKQQWHAFGRSLYLVTKNGKGFWVLHFRDPREGGAIRNTGLGSADQLSLRAAGKKRDEFMVDLAAGRDVHLMTRKARGEIFGKAADAYLDNHADEWSPRTRSDNKALFSRYIPADFAARPVTTITPEHVADVLRPIWDGPGNNRGSRLRRLMFGAFGAKNVHPNPARWDDGPLPNLLSRKRMDVQNREAMPWADVPAFLKTKGDSLEDCAGRFIILTAVRRKEGLGARWHEFDLVNRVWTIPAERMKRRIKHVVPLTDAAIACLGNPGDGDAFVFASARTGGLMGNKALDKEWIGRVNPVNGKHYTLHGFRTSMSTWAEEQDNGRRFPGPVIEAAIAHAKGRENGNGGQAATTQAYLRSDHFKARRELMEEWATFVTSGRYTSEVSDGF